MLAAQLGCAVANGSSGIALPAVSTAYPVEAPLSVVPEWALANPSRLATDEAGSEFGIGSGRNVEEATRYALRDVASRLSVSVESQLRDTMSQSGATTIERLEQVIETRVTGTRFSGWQRTRTEERAGVVWAEVRIDRGRLASESRTELATLAQDVDLQLESARGSALRRLLALQNTAVERERAADLIALIDVLDRNFDRAKWETRRARWREIDAAARRALVFEVRADRDSQEIASWVESKLVADRLRTRNGECASPDAVCIDIRSEVIEADVASRHIAKIRSTLAILEPSGSVVRERDLIGRGDSKSDPARARRKALESLRKHLVTLSVLGDLVAP